MTNKLEGKIKIRSRKLGRKLKIRKSRISRKESRKESRRSKNKKIFRGGCSTCIYNVNSV